MAKVSLKLVVIIFLYCIANSTYGQTDLFIDYQPLVSSGKIPEVFTQKTFTKIENDLSRDRGSMTENEELIFLERIHFSIDELLHSGLVLYGDKTTKYVRKVAENLLKDKRKVKKQLQFFVIKSNVTNALSTDQGLIFVTLGLLSQLENEAQLAYVLSHEIGINLFHKAGYAESELLSAFDVMTYSYLPFDEEPFSHAYMNGDLLFVPDKYYPLKINEIKVEEDYDDSKSSHPNIRKRKDAVVDELANYSSWGTKKFVFAKDEFLEARNLARFESVRVDMLNNEFADVIYKLFLLERDFPNNIYLTRMKVQAWLGLSRFKINGSYSKAVSNPSKIEGESHAVYYMLKKISKIQLLTISMRMIEDARKAFPDDNGINQMHDQMIQHLGEYSRFKIAEYSESTYQDALTAFEHSKAELNDTTSVEVRDTTVNDELSKYDKIKRKRDVKTAVTEDEEFDESKFHLFALSDLISEENFKKKYRKYKDADEMIKNETSSEINLKEIVLLEPVFISVQMGNVRVKQSEELESRLIESVKKTANKFDVTVYDQSNSEVENQNTEQYNSKAVLLDFLRQRSGYGDGTMFPVDYIELEKLQKEFGNAKMMFIYGEHYRNPIKPVAAVIGVLFPPFGIPYFLTKLVTGNRINISYSVLDLKTGDVENFIDYDFNMKPKESVLDAVNYKVMSELSGKKAKR